MPTIRITKKSVEALNSEKAGTIFWDETLAGFGLKILAGGKTYIIQYRLGGRAAATKRYTIGKDGSPWDAPAARAEAERLLRLVQTGVDPRIVAKAREREAIDLSFARVVERYLSEYGERHWRPSTYSIRESDFRRWVVPILTDTPITAVTRADLARVREALPRTTPSMPRNIHVLMRGLFAWALNEQLIQTSPFHGMRVPKSVAARDRVLNDEEFLAILGSTLDLNPAFGAFVRFLAMTGQRRDEIAKMDWVELNRRDKEWVLPAGRSKNHQKHLLPLTSPLIKELDEIAGGTQWPRSGPVFSTNGRSPISGFSKVKARLDALVEAKLEGAIPDWRFHDLRRTVATNLQRLNIRFEVTEALLNHIGAARTGTAAVYMRHDWSSEKREALELWNARIVAMIDRWQAEQAGKGGDDG
ncbi:MAG: tyrosine-type recombinase/integrase [Afipia sp.]|nr:tyrosine-type recombinase/integrase [Afipia sp.]